MLSDVVDHLHHTDCAKLFSLACPLVEDLRMQVVVIVSRILLSLVDQNHYVNTLVNLLGWEMGPQHIDI